MISKISKLKNFGIFHDFIWKADLPNFKKFNLIYGWNRSGKTTISRVFSSCEKKCTYDRERFDQYPALFDEGGHLINEGEFEITTDDGSTIKNTNIASNILQIKVFNQDFINSHISFNPVEPCEPIFYQSKEDFESEKLLKQLKLDQVTFSKTYEQSKKDKDSKAETRNTFLTSLGREIANILFDKSYNKTRVESKINSIGVDNFSDKVLSDEDKKKYESISKSDAEKEQLFISKIQHSDYNYLFTRVKSLLDKKVISELLQRLKGPKDVDGGLDEELNNWVKQGFDIHKNKNQFKKCLFCENGLNDNFFDSLAKHFSKDYEDLQYSIKFLIKDLRIKKITNIPEKNVELYSDLRNLYERVAINYNEVVKKQNDWLWNSEKRLEQKYKNPFSPDIPEMVDIPENYNDLLNSIIDELNKIISTHNLRAKNHNTEVINSKEKLELHSIAVALAEQDYKNMVKELNEAEIKEKDALEVVNKNNSHISELEKQNSDIGKAVIAINKHLEEFFGRKEIELTLDKNGKGYIINRNGKPAKNLSEGEKTAIAFSYFIVKVGEGDFDKTKGIIFIDDPISSLDSNFIYHCFSLIKNHFNEVGQLIISTHNFQFFNLVKDWFTKKNQNRVTEEKEENCGFYMIKSILSLNPRQSKFTTLDITLREHKSEYSFLFSLLRDFDGKEEEPSFEEIYNIANIGRRFFDIFADFKIPSNKKDQKEKIDIIVDEINKKKAKEEEKISKVACDKVFWLINGFSHNSDPTSTIEHKNKIESKDAIKVLLNIVKESDPKHFEILLKNIQS